MNLKKLMDSREDYLKLTQINPNNFYFQLAQKAAPYMTAKSSKNKINVSWNIDSNPVQFYYGGDTVNIVLGGKRFTGKGAGISALEHALYEIFQADLKGTISLHRTKGSNLTDRRDFNHKDASGTMFPKLYKTVAWDKSGKKNSEVLGSRNNAIALTERQFENASTVDSFKKSNFKKVNLGGNTFYLNKSSDLINFNKVQFKYDLDQPAQKLTVDQFYNVLWNIDKNIDYWARTEELAKLSENIDSYKNTVAYYKGKAWIIIPGQYVFNVKPFID